MKYIRITYFLFSLVFITSSLMGTEPQKVLFFTENKGQIFNEKMKVNNEVLYSGTNGKMVYHLKKNGISYQMNQLINAPGVQRENLNSIGKEISIQKLKSYRIDLNWLDVNVEMESSHGKVIEGSSNYYLESCPQGILGVKSYSDVFYKKLYNGIDIHFYSQNGKLKYDYLVSAKANYKNIRLKISGADRVSINEEGNLVIENRIGKIIEGKPIVIQKGRELESKWIVKENIVSFEIKGINQNEPFVIDPEVKMWGTFLGGVGEDYSFSTSSNSNSVFITGCTNSANSINLCTAGAFQTIINNKLDGFISKFDSNGQRLWSTYYGGSGNDKCNSCCITLTGGVYVCGETDSVSNVLSTLNCHQNVFAGVKDGFVAKFDSLGTRVWGTFYGGSLDDMANSCKSDKFDNLVVVGTTLSSSNISSIGSPSPLLNGGFDAFLVKFNSQGQRIWSRYFGGTDSDEGNACDIDTAGNIIIAGTSCSPNGYSTMFAGNGFMTSNTSGVGNNAYLGKLDKDGNVQWGTFYGASYVGSCFPLSKGYGCTFDGQGNIYLVGATNHNKPFIDFNHSYEISTLGSFQPIKYGVPYTLDGFIVKFNPHGSRKWATYIDFAKNGADDKIYDCKTDKSENLIVAGASGGSNVIPNSFSLYPLIGEGMIAKFDSAGQNIFIKSVTGSSFDNVRSISISNEGSFYVTGNAGPINFPYPGNISTPSSFQPNYGGGSSDAFLMKFQDCSGSLSVVAPHYLMCKGHTTTLTASGSTSYTWSNGSNNSSITVSPSITTIYTVSATAGSCNLNSFVEITISSPTLSTYSSHSVLCSGETATITGAGAYSYTWGHPNNKPSLVINPTTTTTYTLTGFDVYGCTSLSIITQSVTSCVGITELSAMNNQFKLFPNPTNNEVTIEYQLQYSNEMKMEIYNVTGKCVFKSEIKETETKIDLLNLESGVYFVKFVDGNNLINTIKLVKL